LRTRYRGVRSWVQLASFARETACDVLGGQTHLRCPAGGSLSKGRELSSHDRQQSSSSFSPTWGRARRLAERSPGLVSARPLLSSEATVAPHPMNHGLLAPQFGIGGIAAEIPDAERATTEIRKPIDNGPTIVVKKRRLIRTHEASSSSAEAQAKLPKVYRLELQASGALPLLDAGVALSHVAERPPVSRRTRRTDPARQPVLVKHVVYERPPLAPAGDRLPADEPQKIGAKALREALRELDAVLAHAVRADQAYRALDELLLDLGVPRNGA
jgi:hypothetical protein